QLAALLRVHRLGRVDRRVHERLQPLQVLLRSGAGPEVHDGEPTPRPAGRVGRFARVELGVYTFADVVPGPDRTVSPEQRMSDLVEEMRLADEVGLTVFGLGEHHRPDYVSSAPAVALAAGAAVTSTIRLTSAVSVLSSDDPVRVFQQFAT